MAVQYGFGVMLDGEIGAGKTETAKELSRMLGRMSFFLCGSKSLTYEGIAKFFKGFL